PRGEAIGFSIGTKGYIGTGVDSSNFLSDFWEYDPSIDAWTQKSNFGGGMLCDAVGFSISNKGYIGIGEYPLTVFNNNFWEYDQATDTWTQKASFGGNVRDEGAGFSLPACGVGYILCGDSFGVAQYNDMWAYYPAQNVWNQMQNYP